MTTSMTFAELAPPSSSYPSIVIDESYVDLDSGTKYRRKSKKKF